MFDIDPNLMFYGSASACFPHAPFYVNESNLVPIPHFMFFRMSLHPQLCVCVSTVQSRSKDQWPADSIVRNLHGS